MPKRAQAFLFLALILLGLVVLAAGLPTLTFQKGLPIPGADDQGYVSAMGSGGNYTGMSLKMLLQAGLGLGFILLLIVLTVNIFRKVDLKTLGKLGLAIVGISALMFVVGQLRLPEPDTTDLQLVANPTPPPVPTVEAAPIGDPPPGLITLVAVAAGAAAVGLGGWLLYKGLRRPAEDPLAREAEAALKAIRAGQDLRDVILACYLKMTEAVKTGRGIEREEGMTPREFEEVLRVRGVPAEPIHQLTALFEKARYSRQKADREEEEQAVACLTAIRLACAPAAEKSMAERQT